MLHNFFFPKKHSSNEKRKIGRSCFLSSLFWIIWREQKNIANENFWSQKKAPKKLRSKHDSQTIVCSLFFCRYAIFCFHRTKPRQVPKLVHGLREGERILSILCCCILKKKLNLLRWGEGKASVAVRTNFVQNRGGSSGWCKHCMYNMERKRRLLLYFLKRLEFANNFNCNKLHTIYYYYYFHIHQLAKKRNYLQISLANVSARKFESFPPYFLPQERNWVS